MIIQTLLTSGCG